MTEPTTPPETPFIPTPPDQIPPAETRPESEQLDPALGRPRRDPLPLLYLLGFIVLGGALAYLWRHPATPAAVTQDASRIETVDQKLEAADQKLQETDQKLQSLEQRVSHIEAQPAAAPIGPEAAPAEPATVSTGPAAAPTSPAPDSTAAAPPADLKPLEQRIAALEQHEAAKPAEPEPKPAPPPPAPDPAIRADLTALATRLDAIASRQDALSGRQGSDLATVTKRLDGEAQRLAEAEKTATQLAAATDKTSRFARIQAASVALEAGQPLGDVPDAPAALARFAKQPPPTEASLRVAFPAASAAAHLASQPAITANEPFLDRIWGRAQQVVTVRQGDRVLLGDPIAGVLARAQQALDVGDLAGAVQALHGLAGPAAAAMADWTQQAQSLLDARAALASIAAHA